MLMRHGSTLRQHWPLRLRQRRLPPLLPPARLPPARLPWALPLLSSLWFCAAAVAQPVADGWSQALSAHPGDATRGRAIVADRRVGLCLLCHSAPIPEERFQGNLAPSLAGAGQRWTPAQLRLRVANSRALNPDSLMPTFHPTSGTALDEAARVATAFRGRPVLDAQQLEDVVAYLATLQ